jgi:hypothetical protein
MAMSHFGMRLTHGCDEVTWEWFSRTRDHLLTTELRKRMNDIVRSLNF